MRVKVYRRRAVSLWLAARARPYARTPVRLSSHVRIEGLRPPKKIKWSTRLIFCYIYIYYEL